MPRAIDPTLSDEEYYRALTRELESYERGTVARDERLRREYYDSLNTGIGSKQELLDRMYDQKQKASGIGSKQELLGRMYDQEQKAIPRDLKLLDTLKKYLAKDLKR